MEKELEMNKAENGEGTMSHNKSLGRLGETAAAELLAYEGYDILERNWKCPYGEADIICRDGCYLVFVEVKTRSNIDHGLPEEAITPKKRKKYEQIAACYLKDSDFSNMGLRFDVIAILALPKQKAIIRHHVNAWGIE